ncbi:MAG TPA: (2Fe-2S) ferredoxin domain-containing protein, partial [bacterium]|nr:(2Fe-2S) ferredoxin domain-containing protein [bacterium]
MNLDELQQIADKERSQRDKLAHCIFVCNAASCQSSRGLEVNQAIDKEIHEREIREQVCVKGAGCMGLCAEGPLVSVEPDGILYSKVTPEDVPEIMDSLDEAPVERLLCSLEQPFFKSQTKIVLENSGKI